MLFALGVVFVGAAAYPGAAYAVVGNWTAPRLALDASETWGGGERYLSVPYAGDSPAQTLDLYVPDAETPPPLLVLIHGGGFIANDARSRQTQFLYRYFRDRGFACASLNYRLAQEAPFPAALSDCKAAIRFLRANAEKYGYDASKVGVWGESAGGYLAVMCAVTGDGDFSDVTFLGEDAAGPVSGKVDALVDFYGHVENTGEASDWKALGIPEVVVRIANGWAYGDVLDGYEDVTSYWFRRNVSEMTEEELAPRGPQWYVENGQLDGLRVLILHGDCDITVPWLQSERLAETLAGVLGEDAVRCRLVKGAGHASDSLFTEERLDEVRAFLRRALS